MLIIELHIRNIDSRNRLTVEDFCGTLTSCKFENVPHCSFTSFDMRSGDPFAI